MLRDPAEFKRGRNGERVVASLLQSRGWLIVPSYDYAGEDGNKAPKMQGAKLSLVIPDLDCSRAGKRFWVEVKTKKTVTLTRTTGIYEHGISKRHYEHYQRVQAESGTLVWLFVYEEAAGLVVAASLDGLGEPRFYLGDKMDPGGMAYWPRDRFKIVGQAPTARAA